MSPKHSSLAYDVDLKEEGIANFSEAFVPTLNVISGKQFAYERRTFSHDRAISITGSLQISF